MIIKKKIYFTIVIFSFLYSLLIGRSFYLQVYKRDQLIKYADTQFIRNIKLAPQRGIIYDKNMVPLAVNIQRFDLYAMPQDMKSRSSIFAVCKIVNGIDCKEIYHKINQRNKFTWIARGISLNEKQLISLRKIDGIYINEIFSRYYPQKTVASTLIGHLNIDNEGIAGIEYSFNEQLKGNTKEITYFKDAKGRPVRLDTYQFNGKGKDVILSIDHKLQASTEKFLTEGIEAVKAKSGGVVILNAKTGEVLTLATSPNFDPNNYSKYSQNARKLSILTDPFEPGSTFKIFTIAAGIEENKITPQSKYFCENGKMKIGKYIVSEAAGHKFGSLTVKDIFKNSSNIGTTKIAMDIGYQKLHKFFEKLKFGQLTGIEIKGESKGLYKEIKKPSLIHLSNLSFGQGLATTPLQIALAYAAIANDGVMPMPTIIKRENEDVPLTRVMSVKTARTLQNMLIQVVEDGTGYNAKINQFEIAGKTSTAQKVGSDGKYSGIIAGFIGFPINANEKIIVYVYVDEPKEKIYGNDVAAPIFQKIMSQYLYESLNVKPTKIAKEKIYIDEVTSKSAAIIREKSPHTIPNFIGMDKVSALELAQKNNIEIDVKGAGVVEKQIPAPYTPSVGVKKIELTFQNMEY